MEMLLKVVLVGYVFYTVLGAPLAAGARDAAGRRVTS